MPEVVRDPRMYFWRVPKLGSYLVIKLEYESCLCEKSLDAALVEAIEVKQRQREQEEEKKVYYDKFEEERLVQD